MGKSILAIHNHMLKQFYIPYTAYLIGFKFKGKILLKWILSINRDLISSVIVQIQKNERINLTKFQ